MHLQSLVADLSLKELKTKAQRTGHSWPEGNPVYQCSGTTGSKAIYFPPSSKNLPRKGWIFAASYLDVRCCKYNRSVATVSLNCVTSQDGSPLLRTLWPTNAHVPVLHVIFTSLNNSSVADVSYTQKTCTDATAAACCSYFAPLVPYSSWPPYEVM